MMKPLVKRFSCLLLLLALVFCAACSAGEEAQAEQKLKYYCLENHGDIVKKYNDYCLDRYDPSYQIEIIEFDNEELMYEKMSTEIMAGKGPDIITLNQKLPFEKLIENGAFADINELALADASPDRINFDDCKKAVMDAGVYGGKRYIVPAFYAPDVLESTIERLAKFGINAQQGTALIYDGAKNVFENFINTPRGWAFIYNDADLSIALQDGDSISCLCYGNNIFYGFIMSYVDFESKKTYFDTDSFRANLDTMTELVINNSSNSQIYTLYNDDGKENTVLFENPVVNGLFSLESTVRSFYFATAETQETPVLLRGFVNDENTYSAHIQYGAAINAGSKLKDKAYCFIKYLLSESVQEYWVGDKEGSNFAGSYCLPVTNEAYAHSLEVARNALDDDYNPILPDGEFSDFTKAYINIIENINSCSLYSYPCDSYYISSVAGEIIADYINGTITKDKFSRQLTSATEIYLTE